MLVVAWLEAPNNQSLQFIVDYRDFIARHLPSTYQLQ